MEAKLRFFGEMEEDAEAVVDSEEAQDELAAECLGNDWIWLGEHSLEEATGFGSGESSVKSISNTGRFDGNGDPSEEGSDCRELVWEERWEEEGNFWRSVEVEGFVDLETLLEPSEVGGRVGEGWEAPSWTGLDPWVLSAGGAGGKPFSIVCSVKAQAL